MNLYSWGNTISLFCCITVIFLIRLRLLDILDELIIIREVPVEEILDKSTELRRLFLAKSYFYYFSLCWYLFSFPMSIVVNFYFSVFIFSDLDFLLKCILPLMNKSPIWSPFEFISKTFLCINCSLSYKVPLATNLT